MIQEEGGSTLPGHKGVCGESWEPSGSALVLGNFAGVTTA
jgi:hypothetical protein